MEFRERETTDRAGRLGAAARSFGRYFDKQDHELRIAIQLARQEIDAGRGNVAETRRSLAVLEDERSELHRRWRLSSFRRHLEATGHELAALEGRECRAVGVAGSLDSAQSRAAVTSSTRVAKSLIGYAAVFNQLSPNYHGFREVIRPGAFRRSLETSDVRLLLNHDANFLFARTTSATLELAENSHGLRFVAHLLRWDAPSYHLARLIDRRDLSGCSFSFSLGRDNWILAKKPGDIDIREILEVDTLFDVGPVVYPWYPQTSVAAVFETVTRSEEPGPAARPARAHVARALAAEADAIISRNPQRTISAARQKRLVSELEAVEKDIRIAVYKWPWLRGN